MRQLCCWWIMLMLVGCGIGQSAQPQTAPPLLVYAPSQNGRPQQGLIVADAAGKELRRIETPYISRMYPIGNRLVVRTLDDELLIIDPQAGTAQKIMLPPDTDLDVSPSFTEPTGRTWLVLANARRNQVALINVQTGTVIDVATLLDEPTFFISALLSSDETFVIVNTDEGSWLIPTADSKAMRQIGQSRTLTTDISQDGTSLLYINANDTGKSVALADRATLTPQVIAEGKTIGFAQFMSQDTQIVIADDANILIYERKTQQTRTIVRESADPIQFMLVAPSGERLYAREQNDDFTWQMVDVKTGTIEPLNLLNGFVPTTQAPTSRYTLWFDPNRQAKQLISLDLETGITSVVLENPDTVLFAPTPINAPAPWALPILATSESEEQWLINLETSTSTLLTKHSGGSALSPDGKLLAVSERQESNGQRTRPLSIGATGSDQRTVIGEGSNPIWVQP